MISRGGITGKSLTGKYDPSTLEGWGNQIGIGAEIFNGGTWGSFNSLQDATTNQNATFSGKFFGLSPTIGIQLRKSKIDGSVGITRSTLIKPIKQKK